MKHMVLEKYRKPNIILTMSEVEKANHGLSSHGKGKEEAMCRNLYVWEGDANTCFFHLLANGRHWENFIQHLRNGNN
jgi:hypothetical protein